MTDLLDALMCEVLAKMSVISEQKGRSYDGISVHGGEKSGLQPLIEKPLVDYYRDRFNRAHSPRARREVVTAAIQGLKVARKMLASADLEPARDSFEWKCAVADDPRPTKEVQRIYSISRATVNRYRLQYRGVAQTIWTAD